MDYTVHGILQARKLEWVAFLLWDLPNPGIKPKSPMLQAESLPAEPQTSILLEQLSYPESEIIHLDFIILWVIRVTRSQTMGTLCSWPCFDVFCMASPIKVNFLDCLISLTLQRNLLKIWIWHSWFDLSHPHSVDSNLHVTLTHFKVALVVKNLPDSAGDIRDLGLIPGSGRSPWKRTWQPTLVFMPSIQAPMNRGAWWAMIHRVTKSMPSIQAPMNRGAWWAMIHRVTKSQTWLIN